MSAVLSPARWAEVVRGTALRFGRWRRRAAVSALALAAVLGGCTQERELSRLPDFLIQVGSDFTTAGALGIDGSLLVGVNSSGVGITERVDPNTGQILRGAQGKSLQSHLFSVDMRGNLLWKASFPVEVSAPVVASDGTIYVSSGDVLYARSAKGKALRERSVQGRALSLCGDESVIAAGPLGIHVVSRDGATMADLMQDPLLKGRGASLPLLCTGDGQLVGVTEPGTGGAQQQERWLTALELSGAHLWHTALPKGAPEALLRDAAGRFYVTYRSPMQTLVFGPTGALERTLADVSVTAISGQTLVGTAIVEKGGAVVSLDLEGKRRWSHPLGRSSSAPIITSDGTVHFAQDTHVGDFGSGQSEVDSVRADGTLAHRYLVAMNAYSGPMLVATDGTLLATGFWANQNPPFQALVGGMWSHSNKLATGWPRLGGDSRNTSFAGPVLKALPGLPQLRGRWLAAEAPWRTLHIGPAEPSWAEIGAGATSYGVWSATDLGLATLVERGTLTVGSGAIQLQPTWRADGAPLVAYSRALRAGDAWRLELDDPLQAKAARTFRRVYGPTASPSPFDTAGKVLWSAELSGNADERATALAAANKPGKVWMAGTYAGGIAFYDPAAGGAMTKESINAFYSVIDRNDLDNARASYDVAKTKEAGTPARILSLPDGGALALAVAPLNETEKSGYVFSLRRFDASGLPGKRTDFGAPGFSGAAVDLVLRSDGGATIVGWASGGASLGDKAIPAGDAQQRIWLARTDANDALVDIQVVASGGAWQKPHEALSDSAGRLWIVGNRTPMPGPNTKLGDGLALWKLEADGKLLWTKAYSGDVLFGTLWARLALGPADEVAVFGSFDGTLTMSSESLKSSGEVGDSDGFVARLATDGSVLWLRGFVAPEPQAVTVAAFDSHGVLHVGGVLGPAIGPRQQLPPVVSQPIYAGFSPCGERLWLREVEDCLTCQFTWLTPQAMIRHSDDTLYVAASIAGSPRLAGTTLISPPLGSAPLVYANLSLHQLSGVGTAGIAALKKAKACAPLTDPPHKVSVELLGLGAGQVVSEPAGIDCPGTCSATFPAAQAVKLKAKAAANAHFVGWGGDCAGTDVCAVAAGQGGTLTATFERPHVSALDSVGGGPGDEAIALLAADAGGAFFLAPLAAKELGGGPADFGAGVVAGHGATDVVVGRRTVEGKTAWTVAIGGLLYDDGIGISGDGAGGVIAGAIIGASTANVGSLAVSAIDGVGNVLLARLDADGKPIWAKFLAQASDGGTHLHGNGLGNVVVTSRVPSPMTLHGMEIKADYAMMVKADGAVAWVRALPPLQVATVDVGPQGWTALAYRRTDSPQVELVVIDGLGQDIWTFATKAFPGPSFVALGADGSLVAIGMVGGAADFAPTLAGMPTWARFSASGALLGVAALATAPRTLTAMTQVGAAIAGGGVCYVGADNASVIALGPDGALLWKLSTPQVDAIAATPGGPLWFGGGVQGTAKVGGLHLSVPANHHRDAWLARVMP